MVQITTFAFAAFATVTSVSAARNCPVGYKLCGFTLNNGIYEYSLDQLKEAQRLADVTVPDNHWLVNSIYVCADDEGTITTDKASVCGDCEQRWAAGDPPFEDARCKP